MSLATLFLVAVIFIDGLSKKEAPGSLWDPAHTSLSFAGVGQLGLSFGLIMEVVGERMTAHLANIAQLVFSFQGMPSSHRWLGI